MRMGRHAHRAILRTLALIALVGSPAFAAAQPEERPTLGFRAEPAAAQPTAPPLAPVLLAPPSSTPIPAELLRLGFEPLPSEIRGPLFEYCPLVTVMQPIVPMPDGDSPAVELPRRDAPVPLFEPMIQQVHHQTAEEGNAPLFEYRPFVEMVQPVEYLPPPDSDAVEARPTSAPSSVVQTQGELPSGPAGPGSCAACIIAGTRFCCGLHECLCRADPCYQPCWHPLVDTAFDVASVRPRTQQRLRWDAGLNLKLPDRAEFFWARADGNGRGPAPAAGRLVASNRVRYDDLSYYFEAAIEKFALIVNVPYRSLSPADSPHSAGLGDIKFGAKSVIFDSELLQVGAQLLAYAPTANEAKGLGAGHYSLEPSLLFGMRLAPETYLQAQISEWIPLRGDRDYAGAVLHTHVAVNHVLTHVLTDCPLIGTLAVNTWSFQDGAFTDPILGANQRASGATYCTVGPGLRLFICDRIDLGFAAQFAVTNPHFAGQIYTTEFRWRF